METNNNKQNQLQETLGWQLRDRVQYPATGNAPLNEADQRSYADRSSTAGTGRYVPAGVTGHLRPLLARRNHQAGAGKGSTDCDLDPISRLEQVIGGNSSHSAATDTKKASNTVVAPMPSRAPGSFVSSELVHHRQNLPDRDRKQLVRPIVKQRLQPIENRDDYVIGSDASHIAAKVQTSIHQRHLTSNQPHDYAEKPSPALQKPFPTEKELELQQIYHFQQQEKERNQLLKARMQKDIELQLSQARHELELQRRKNAELERDLMQHQDAHLKRISQTHITEGVNRKLVTQLGHEEVKVNLSGFRSDRALDHQLRLAKEQNITAEYDQDAKPKREQHWNSPDASLEKLKFETLLSPRQIKSSRDNGGMEQLLVMEKLAALKRNRLHSATETSDNEDGLVRGDRQNERQSTRLSESESDSSQRIMKPTENSHSHQRFGHQGSSQRNWIRASNNWQAQEIGDAFKNQSSLMQMVETAAVNQTLQRMHKRSELQSEADGSAGMPQIGRRLRSRLDSGQRHYQQHPDEVGRQDHASSRQLIYHEGNPAVAQNFDRQPYESCQFHRLRSRSYERGYSRSAHTSELLMSSSSGRPVGLGRLLENSLSDSDDSSKNSPWRNAMEVDVSFTSSEEESGDEGEKNAERQRRLIQRNKDRSQRSPPQSDGEQDADEQRSDQRRSSRKESNIEDDDKIEDTDDNDDEMIDKNDENLVSDSKPDKGNADRSSRRLSDKQPEAESLQDPARPVPRRSMRNSDEKALTDQQKPNRQSKKQSENDEQEDLSKSMPRKSIRNEDDQSRPNRQSEKRSSIVRRSVKDNDEADYNDDSKLKSQPEKQAETMPPRSAIRKSIGKEDYADQSGPVKNAEKQTKSVQVMSRPFPRSAEIEENVDPESEEKSRVRPSQQSEELSKSIPRRSVGNEDKIDNKEKPPERSDDAGPVRRNSASKGARSMPEEWAGRPAPSLHPVRSDENSNTEENDDQNDEVKMFKLPKAQKRVVLDSDDDDSNDEERRRRTRRKQQSRRPSKVSVASKLSKTAAQHTDDEDDDHRDSGTLDAGADDQPSEAVDGGENVDSRFQNPKANAAKQDADSDAEQKDAEISDNDEEPQTAVKPKALSLGDDADVQPALKEKTLNDSMKLGIAGEQTGLQQPQQEQPQDEPKPASHRSSWRSKHNKAAPDSYTQDSEHRGLLDDTRDTDSDTRSTPPGPYALQPESGGKVQLLANRFLAHQEQLRKKKEDEAAAEAAAERARMEASKPGAAATSTVKDSKVTLLDRKALVKTVNRLPAAEGGALQVKPEDTLSQEDIEACKTRAQKKNEERRKRRENKLAGQAAPAQDSDDDDDVAPVSQQEGMVDQPKRTSRKEPDEGDNAPMTGDAPTQPEEKRRDSEGVMALERKLPKPKSSKPKDADRGPIMPTRPHRHRKRRRSSRVEPLARSVSLPPQPTVIYCCPPCPPPANSCAMRCAVPSCYQPVCCSVVCRRC